MTEQFKDGAEAKASAINILEWLTPILNLLPELMALQAELNAGQPVSTPAVDVTIGGVKYALTLNAQKAS